MYATLVMPSRTRELFRLLMAVLAVAAVLLVAPVAKETVANLSSATAVTPSRHGTDVLRPSVGLSAAIARLQRQNHPSWSFTASGGAFETHLSPGLPTTVDGDGTVRIVDTPSRVALALTPVGVGRTVLTPLAATAARADGTSLVQPLGPATARYANSAHGLEQSFVLDRRPAGSGSTVTIALRASGATPTLQDGAVRFLAGGAPAFSYGDLHVRDATGATVPARFAVVGNAVHVVIDDRGAHYPLVVDPTFTTAGDLATGGTSVSLSDNGKVAVVGAAWDDDPTDTIPSAGQVFVLAQNSGGTWQSITLAAPSPIPSQPTFWQTANAYFGYAVAVSSDGEEILVTAPGVSLGSGGAAMVYSLTLNPTTQQPEATWGGYLQPVSTTHESPGGFGASAAVWHDAGLDLVEAFVGAPESGKGGAVYEFTDPTLTTYGNGNDNYAPDENAVALYDGTDPNLGSAGIGTSIALSPQNLLFAGGPTYDSDAGIVTNWLWENWPGNGQPSAPSDDGSSCGCSITGRAAGDLLGTSVSADAGGTLYAAGEPGATPDGSTVASGAVVVSEYDGLGTDFGPKTGGVSDEAFGTSVAMSDDGSTVLVGAPITGYSDDAANGSGLTPYAYVESSTGTTWASPAEQAFAGSVGTYYGERVTMAGDMSDALVGAPMANLFSFAQGETYYFLGPQPPSKPTITGTPGAGTTSGSYDFTFSVSGSPTPTLSVTSGSLPPGVTLSGDSLTGKPTAAGTYPATVTATNSQGSATDSFSITITSTLPTVLSLAPKVGTTAGGTVVTVTGTGFTGAIKVTFGTKAGTRLKVTSATKLTVAAPAGTGTAAVSVTTPAGTSAASAGDVFTYSTTAVAVTSATLPAATVGVPYSQTLAAKGGTPPYTAWSKVSGNLPPGLGGPSATGAVSGTPTTAGTYTFIVKVTNAGSNDSKSVKIVVAA